MELTTQDICAECQRHARGRTFAVDYGEKPPGVSPSTGKPVVKHLGRIERFLCDQCVNRMVRLRRLLAAASAAVFGGYMAYHVRDDIAGIDFEAPVVVAMGAMLAGVLSFLSDRFWLPKQVQVEEILVSKYAQRPAASSAEVVRYPAE